MPVHFITIYFGCSCTFEILIELSDKLDILDTVGIDEGSSIIKVEESLEINKEFVLIMDDCLSMVFVDV